MKQCSVPKNIFVQPIEGIDAYFSFVPMDWSDEEQILLEMNGDEDHPVITPSQDENVPNKFSAQVSTDSDKNGERISDWINKRARLFGVMYNKNVRTIFFLENSRNEHLKYWYLENYEEHFFAVLIHFYSIDPYSKDCHSCLIEVRKVEEEDGQLTCYFWLIDSLKNQKLENDIIKLFAEFSNESQEKFVFEKKRCYQQSENSSDCAVLTLINLLNLVRGEDVPMRFTKEQIKLKRNEFDEMVVHSFPNSQESM